MLDLHARKVLVIAWRKNGEYLLFKSRKNIGEELKTTALHKTFKETGFNCQLLPYSFLTLATIDPAKTIDEEGQSIVEPFAVTQRTTDGKLKIIFWYLARTDFTTPKTHGTQTADENFETV